MYSKEKIQITRRKKVFYETERGGREREGARGRERGGRERERERINVFE